MSIQVRFTDEDWARHERNWTAWWEGELERPLVVMTSIADGVPYVEEAIFFPLEMPAEQVIDHYQTWLEARRFYGDSWPKWLPSFGPGIIVGFIGADVVCAPDTVWFRPVDLDIVASLRDTQRLLIDLCDAPEEVARLADEVTRLWLRYYAELDAIIQPAGRGTTPWAPIWSPGRCYMLQCDFAYMISPAMFERFVLPGLAACCDYLDHPFYHMDGKGQIPHLDMLLSLEPLRGIQWVPGDGSPPPEAWLPLLKRIRDAGKLCQLGVSPEGARKIVRALGGRGFAFFIENYNFKTAAEATDFLRVLAAEDANT
ncbi:MAG: hypothetical protein Kow00120_05090 [Anaerolineae bacterium]